MGIYPDIGLPGEKSIKEELAREQQRITVRKEKRKFGKIITIVSGFDSDIEIKHVAKELKKRLACGGTIKEREIELQGDHTHKVKEKLVELGFPSENIEVT